jgi:hypothetical protein
VTQKRNLPPVASRTFLKIKESRIEAPGRLWESRKDLRERAPQKRCLTSAGLLFTRFETPFAHVLPDGGDAGHDGGRKLPEVAFAVPD